MRGIWGRSLWLLLPVVVLAGACHQSAVLIPPGGESLHLRMEFPGGETAAATQVLRRRLERLGIQDFEVTSSGKRGLDVQVRGVSSAEAIRLLLTLEGRVGIHRVAEDSRVLADGYRELPPEMQRSVELVEGGDLAPTLRAESFDALRAACEKIASSSDEAGIGIALQIDQGIAQAFPIVPRPELGNPDIAEAAVRNPAEGPGKVLDLKLKPEAKSRFADLTTASIGKRLAILFDGKVVVAPIVREAIAGGKLTVSGLGEPGASQIERDLTVEFWGLMLGLPPLPEKPEILKVSG